MFGNTNIIQYRVLDYHSVQHISSTQGPLLFSPQDPSVQHVQCVNPTPKNHQFTTKKRPFNKPVSSTHKKRQFSIKKRPFNTPVSSKPKNRQFNTNLFPFFRVLNWRFLCVVRTLLYCWTGGFWVVKRSGHFALNWCVDLFFVVFHYVFLLQNINFYKLWFRLGIV